MRGYFSSLIPMLRKYASMGGPACNCSAMMPLSLAESCRSAVSTPFNFNWM